MNAKEFDELLERKIKLYEEKIEMEEHNYNFTIDDIAKEKIKIRINLYKEMVKEMKELFYINKED